MFPFCSVFLLFFTLVESLQLCPLAGLVLGSETELGAKSQERTPDDVEPGDQSPGVLLSPAVCSPSVRGVQSCIYYMAAK